MKYRLEKLAFIWDQVVAMGRAHWAENKHAFAFNPDKKRYLQYEAMGCYFHFGARAEDGTLVGTGGIYIMPSMHTQQIICTEDSYYLMPSHRNGRNALRFFQFMEAFARERGAVEVQLTTPLTNLNAERIILFQGYYQTAKGWSKPLETPNVQSIASSAS